MQIQDKLARFRYAKYQAAFPPVFGPADLFKPRIEPKTRVHSATIMAGNDQTVDARRTEEEE